MLALPNPLFLLPRDFWFNLLTDEAPLNKLFFFLQILMWMS